ncbi:kinetochore Sim4 complex subunit FTA2-domain-containing protein [Nemania sp. FL0031]|nr:kinetochore Sim4 complex subunit FTA2-domain-containing protein [Nemania sp. FL0031]
MARRGRPPKPDTKIVERARLPGLQQRSLAPGQNAKRGRPTKLNAQIEERGRLSQNHEPQKPAVNWAKRGRLSKKGSIASPIPPLPLCPLPAIHPFKHQEASIEWGERLDEIPGSSEEVKSFVFKVKINSELYVLKIFNFFDPEDAKWEAGSELGEDYPLEKAIAYTDPFYAECRAYGRIKEAEDKGEVREKLATKCHGYIFLDKDAQNWLEGEGIDLGTEWLNDEVVSIIAGGGRPRALVKDFESAGPGLDEQTEQQIRTIFRRVCLLNNLGIYNRDVRAENFRNGWLVDFDTSYTLPHDIYNALPPSEAEDTQAEDVAKFEDMIEEAGKKMVFLPRKRFNLRPRLKRFQYDGDPIKECLIYR